MRYTMQIGADAKKKLSQAESPFKCDVTLFIALVAAGTTRANIKASPILIPVSTRAEGQRTSPNKREYSYRNTARGNSRKGIRYAA